MRQPTDEEKDIIEKLLTDSLSPRGREKLNSYGFINEAIHTQWEVASDTYTNEQKERRILTNIMRKIKKGKAGRFRQNLNRYAWVASIALLLICGTLSVALLNKQPEPEVWYVLNSGRQSMDSLRLADGTFVVLNAGSRLTYPKVFSGDRREVTLSGQAFFNVHPDKAHPFVVRTKNMNVTALGTAFEVFSYDEDVSLETVLLNGLIKVEPKDSEERIQGEYVLNPNEKLTYGKGGAVRIEQVDANTYSAWRTCGGLSFKNEKLSMILPRLEKWYGLKIDCSPKIADYYRFTFTLRNEPLDLILNIMSHSAPLSYKLKSNDYYVLKGLK